MIFALITMKMCVPKHINTFIHIRLKVSHGGNVDVSVLSEFKLCTCMHRLQRTKPTAKYPAQKRRMRSS